jgi:hypothetical protein
VLIDALETELGNGHRFSEELRSQVVKGYVELSSATQFHSTFCFLSIVGAQYVLLSLMLCCFSIVSCRNTEVDFVWSGLEETMLQSWDNVKCTAQERVCLETCMIIF